MLLELDTENITDDVYLRNIASALREQAASGVTRAAKQKKISMRLEGKDHIHNITKDFL